MLNLDKDTVTYITIHFAKFFTEDERLAQRHLSSMVKLNLTNSDITTSKFANVYKKVGWLSEDEHILFLIKDGKEAFLHGVASRILLEHQHDLVMNYCSNCNRLARTPFAKQCHFCGHVWR